MTTNEFFTTAGMRRITNGQDTPRSLYQAMHRLYRVVKKLRAGNQHLLANQKIDMFRVYVDGRGEVHFKTCYNVSRDLVPVTLFWPAETRWDYYSSRLPVVYGNIRRGLAVMQSRAVS